MWERRTENNRKLEMLIIIEACDIDYFIIILFLTSCTDLSCNHNKRREGDEQKKNIYIHRVRKK